MYDIHYTGRQDNKVVLVKPYTFNNRTIPTGYASDGLTIPVIFRLWINKFSPKYLPCAYMHDMLTNMAYKLFTTGDKQSAYKLFEEADRTFQIMLTIADGGILGTRAYMMHKAVVAYHKFRYKL